jgi:drug/metabolite transporter (DMT)-like permease
MRIAAQRPAVQWIAFAPGLFVLLWSTGFIFTKLGIPYAEPFTFLAIRFAISAAILASLAVAVRAPWPATWRARGHIVVAGLLLHGVYLGGVFSATAHGVPTGVVALIAGIQPLLTALLVGPLLGDRVSPRQWLGIVLGFGGVVLVVWERIAFGGATAAGIGFAVMCLAGITTGTLYQKRFCADLDLRSGTAVQLAGAMLFCIAVAAVTETMVVHWTGEFVFALGWLVLVLSIAAFSLLFTLLRRGAAARVASLFYLTPPTTALMGFALFGETLGWPAVLGMLVAAAGVALVNR